MCEPEEMEKPGPRTVGVTEKLLFSRTEWQANTDEVEETTNKEKETEQTGSRVRPWSWKFLPYLCLRQIFVWLSDQERCQASLVCKHWYQVMHSPCLWRSRIYKFSGHLNEQKVAVGYARSLGRYLQELEVQVIRRNNDLDARRIWITLNLLLEKLIKVRACLQSFTLSYINERTKNSTWRIKTSMPRWLIGFLRRNAYHLRHLCLRGACLTLSKGMEILEVVATIQEQQHYRGHRGILSLDLQNFFSNLTGVYESQPFPQIMQRFWGLEYLRLDYRSVNNEMLEALASAYSAAAWAKAKRRNWRDNRGTLRSLFLYCDLSVSLGQVVQSSTWERLAENCPELEVHVHLEHIDKTDRLAQVLLPKVPIKSCSMNSWYSSEWCAKHIFTIFLPAYRTQLQSLTLNLKNYFESLDDELCQLVLMCERLVYLKAWAFLEVTFVDHLLYNCVEKKCALQTINLRIYNRWGRKHINEMKLKEVLLNYSLLTETKVKCSAIVA